MILDYNSGAVAVVSLGDYDILLQQAGRLCQATVYFIPGSLSFLLASYLLSLIFYRLRMVDYWVTTGVDFSVGL